MLPQSGFRRCLIDFNKLGRLIISSIVYLLSTLCFLPLLGTNIVTPQGVCQSLLVIPVFIWGSNSIPVCVQGWIISPYAYGDYVSCYPCTCMHMGSMAMRIRWCGAKHIALYGRSRATLDATATGRRHWASIRPVLPRRMLWSSILA